MGEATAHNLLESIAADRIVRLIVGIAGILYSYRNAKTEEE